MSAKNRKKTESFIISYIDKIVPESKNPDIYRKLFSRMNDDQFSTFIDELESGKRILSVIVPNLTGVKTSVENNYKIAEELGHDFFEQIWIEGKGDTPTYLTPIKYLVVDLPLRRASQSLVKKISVPDHNRIVDTITGQPTGDSKGAKISYPELQVSAAMGLENTMVELMKYRGGDNKGWNAYTAMLSKLGTTNLKTLSNYASGVESTATLKTFLTCVHLKSTL
jgi:hypothetical protein